jgi:hypothetical protein
MPGNSPSRIEGGAASPQHPFVILPGPNDQLALSVDEALADISAAEAPTGPAAEGAASGAAAQLPPTILTPSRLRIDSRILMAHTSIQWLTNCVFAICILLKVPTHSLG